MSSAHQYVAERRSAPSRSGAPGWWVVATRELKDVWFGGKGPKVRALQMYLGIKCDPTQTFLHGTYQARSHYVMVLTPKECAAFRVHEVDVDCTWTNMAGE